MSISFERAREFGVLGKPTQLIRTVHEFGVLRKPTRLKFDQIKLTFDDWRSISMEENRLIGFGIEIKPSHHSKEQRYQCLCTTSCPMSNLSKEKEKLFLTSKTSPFRPFLGVTWWIIVLNSVGKPTPSPHAKILFPFFFLFSSISNSIPMLGRD